MSIFDAQRIDISCDSCKKRITKSLGWAKTHSHLICQCGKTINIDARQYSRTMADFDKQIARFGNITKKITFKF